ncbi:MAG: biopolymer transporter ExbD [Opitutales bacterium]|nr:biopolymer transporter ExbD [Opitutales bacterium]
MTPINVFSKIPKERISIGSVAIVDIILIAFILMLSMSKFVLAPGFSIGVDNNLPNMANPNYAKIDSDLTVLTAKTNSMIIFDGAIYDSSILSKKMATKRHKGTLLIKADKNLTVQQLLKIAEAAKIGGFDKIHIATNPEN